MLWLARMNERMNSRPSVSEIVEVPLAVEFVEARTVPPPASARGNEAEGIDSTVEICCVCQHLLTRLLLTPKLDPQLAI